LCRKDGHFAKKYSAALIVDEIIDMRNHHMHTKILMATPKKNRQNCRKNGR